MLGSSTDGHLHVVTAGCLLIAAVDEPIQGERERVHEVQRDIGNLVPLIGRPEREIFGDQELLGGALSVCPFSIHPALS